MQNFFLFFIGELFDTRQGFWQCKTHCILLTFSNITSFKFLFFIIISDR